MAYLVIFFFFSKNSSTLLLSVESVNVPDLGGAGGGICEDCSKFSWGGLVRESLETKNV